MKYLFLLLLCFSTAAHAQKFEFPEAKFITGDSIVYSDPAFDDSKWIGLKTNAPWDAQGFAAYDGYAWYRIHLVMPEEALKTGNPIRFDIGKADDACEVYFNGIKIGKSGSFPSDKAGYISTWNQPLEFFIDPKSSFINWNQLNVISIKIYDGNGGGGLFGSNPFINVMETIEGIKISTVDFEAKKPMMSISNVFPATIEGRYSIVCMDEDEQTVISKTENDISLAKDEKRWIDIPVVKDKKHISYVYSFTEKKLQRSVIVRQVLSYILTPKPGDKPSINGAKVYGVRPNSPFIFKIPATGKKPMQYSVENLPAGFKVDPVNGVITGKLSRSGQYKLTFVVKNVVGVAKRAFTITCGDLLTLTPPMGWNSWNCWGLSVSDEKLKASARAMIDKGLMDHGWAYMNIDDGWEAASRNAKGEIGTNDKFPDMKKLGDWLHGNGLKFGIYSSPGTTTCGGYLGSYRHELQDAATYASWGIDYLKYDWCSYGDIHDRKDTSLASYKKPYEVMQQALLQQPRDIVYSLCQYGMKNVWEWGETVNGNCWRTTGDITDTWESLSDIGFNQTKQYPFAKPGRWNDPDMMIVGKVGWGDQLHQTRLNADEQYTHVSLWSLLSAPLLIGCDLSKLDDFTLNLLTNDEVIAVNQDVLGKQAQQLIVTKEYQVWMKEMEDGSKAVGIFNTSNNNDVIRFYWSQLKVGEKQKVRDLWRQKDLGTFAHMFSTRVASHGVTLIKISSN